MRDERLGKAGDGDDVAGEALLDRRALQAAEGQHLGDAAFLDHRAVTVEHFYGLVRFHAARKDPAGDDAAEIGIGLQDGAQHAEWAVLDIRRRHMANDKVEQRRHALVLGSRGVGRHPALLGRAVEKRKIELLFGGVERGEQVEDLVGDFGGPGVGPIDLVDDHDGPQPHLERLGDHELGLRQRPLGGIDQHQHAVHHVEDALDLAAEIGVAGRIHDIYARVAPDQRGHLRQDGDAAFALEIIRIHRALGDALILAKCAGLLQQPVDQGGFAMVDVGDNGNVAKVHAASAKSLAGPEGPACGRNIVSRFADAMSP